MKVQRNLVFVVVGDAPSGSEEFMKQLKQYAQISGIEDRVKFIAFRRDISPIMNALDTLVLASTEEPFGRVLIEAMSMGVPVVATNAGGVPEIITDQVNGFLYSPGNHAELASLLQGMFGDDLRELIVNAKCTVEKKFRIDGTTRRVEEVYRRLLGW